MYVLGRYRVDPTQRVLLCDSQIVPLPPKTFDLLLALVEARGQVISKEHLLNSIWPDAFVEEGNLAKGVHLLRKQLGQDVIETIPKRGYRMAAPVRQVDDPDPATERNAPSDAVGQLHSPKRRRPASRRVAIAAVVLLAGVVVSAVGLRRGHDPITSIAIVPFLTSGATDPLLALGFTQELASRLYAVKGLRVVSPDTSTDPRAAAAKLPVQAVLTGSLQYSNSDSQVSARLVNARDGTVLWAEQMHGGAVTNLYEAQKILAAGVVARLRGRFMPRARASVERRGSTSADAYMAFLRGRAEVARIGAGSLPEAHVSPCAYFEQAIRLDPGFADAWAWLAICEQGAASGPRPAPVEHAHRALSIDPDNIAARRALAYFYSSAGYAEQGLREAKTAIAINPDDPDAALAAARAYFRASMLDRAMDLYERYLASHPEDDGVRTDLVTLCVFADAYERGIRAAAPALVVQRLYYPADLLYANSGDSQRAVEMARKSIAPASAGVAALYFGPLILKAAGLEQEARETWTRAAELISARLRVEDNARTRIWLAMMYAQLGRGDDVREQIRRGIELNQARDPWTLFFSSETYALIGDRTSAIDSLRECIAKGFLGLHYLTYYQKPFYGWHRYRSDPEFRAIYAGLAQRVADLRARL